MIALWDRDVLGTWGVFERVFPRPPFLPSLPLPPSHRCLSELCPGIADTNSTPWTPTRAVAHPLVDIEASDLGPQLTNRLSYSVAELMLWKDIGDFVNDFREKDLGVAQMQTAFSPGLLMRLNCPITYFR